MTISNSSSMKYLGVTLDNTLSGDSIAYQKRSMGDSIFYTGIQIA